MGHTGTAAQALDDRAVNGGARRRFNDEKMNMECNKMSGQPPGMHNDLQSKKLKTYFLAKTISWLYKLEVETLTKFYLRKPYFNCLIPVYLEHPSRVQLGAIWIPLFLKEIKFI